MQQVGNVVLEVFPKYYKGILRTQESKKYRYFLPFCNTGNVYKIYDQFEKRRID